MIEVKHHGQTLDWETHIRFDFDSYSTVGVTAAILNSLTCIKKLLWNAQGANKYLVARCGSHVTYYNITYTHNT